MSCQECFQEIESNQLYCSNCGFEAKDESNLTNKFFKLAFKLPSGDRKELLTKLGYEIPNSFIDDKDTGFYKDESQLHRSMLLCKVCNSLHREEIDNLIMNSEFSMRAISEWLKTKYDEIIGVFSIRNHINKDHINEEKHPYSRDLPQEYGIPIGCTTTIGNKSDKRNAHILEIIFILSPFIIGLIYYILNRVW